MIFKRGIPSTIAEEVLQYLLPSKFSAYHSGAVLFIQDPKGTISRIPVKTFMGSYEKLVLESVRGNIEVTPETLQCLDQLMKEPVFKAAVSEKFEFVTDTRNTSVVEHFTKLSQKHEAK